MTIYFKSFLVKSDSISEVNFNAKIHKYAHIEILSVNAQHSLKWVLLDWQVQSVPSNLLFLHMYV